jgi:hypothetical protein
MCLLRPTRLAKKLFLVAILTFALCVPTSAAVINVNVMVHGFSGMQTIGTICTQTGTPTSDIITADFTFSNSFKGDILDGWYDFQWVQVVISGPTDWSHYTNKLFDQYPNIDPQAFPKNSSEDNEPYYWNQTTEWDVGWFGSMDIRDEGVFSRFYDKPNLLAGDGFEFNTFLVAQDLTAGDFTGKKFSVLAGFNWTYTGGTDVSTRTRPVFNNKLLAENLAELGGNNAGNGVVGATCALGHDHGYGSRWVICLG